MTTSGAKTNQTETGMHWNLHGMKQMDEQTFSDAKFAKTNSGTV